MKVNQPGAHLDHMLRQTRMHHVQLSSMADIKANMLLTVSSVTVTLLAPYTLKPEFRWPVIVFIGFALATIVLAIYTVMPKVPIRQPRVQKGTERHPMFNLLFFSDFARMPYDEFTQEMEEVLNDHSKAYQLQVREIYTLGVFLARKKYRVLKMAYLTFLAGLVASGMTLAIMELL